MKAIPTHYYKKEWYKDIEFKMDEISDVYEKVGERIFKPHCLDFHQFFFVSDGEGEHEVDFEKFSIKKKTLIPLISGQVQSHIADQNIKGFTIVFTSNFLIHEEVNLKYLFNSLTFNPFIKPIQIQCDDELVTLIMMLKKAFINNNTFEYQEVLRSYLKLIILKVEEIKRQSVGTSNDIPFNVYSSFYQELSHHINYKTKIADIFKLLNTDGKKISAALKKTVNKSPKQLLDERIVLELKRLLSYTNLSIKEIAHQLGFDEAANMANYFKKHVGCSPSAFRESIKII